MASTFLKFIASNSVQPAKTLPLVAAERRHYRQLPKDWQIAAYKPLLMPAGPDDTD